MVRKEVKEINVISDATRFSLGRKVRGDGVLLEQPLMNKASSLIQFHVPSQFSTFDSLYDPLAPVHGHKNPEVRGCGDATGHTNMGSRVQIPRTYIEGQMW